MSLHFFGVLAGSAIISLGLFYMNSDSDMKQARAQSTFDPSVPDGLYLSSGKEDTLAAGGLFYQTFKETYEQNLNKIDSFHTRSGVSFQGIVDNERIPFSDYWFPEKYGGTNGPFKGSGDNSLATYALNLYDQAFHGGQSKSAAWEAQHHNQANPSWYGHCNGISAAASRHQNPGGADHKIVKRPVGCEANNNCVEFTPKVIRALLAEIYMNSIARFVGGHRCEIQEEELAKDVENRLDPESMNPCEDPDAGTFHIAVTNWLGRKKQVLIGDFNRDVEVWNYPIYEYQYSYENDGKRLNRQEALSETRSTRHTDYAFNKDAVSFVVVNMKLYYAKALDETKQDPSDEMPPFTRYRRLRYLLELDQNDNIIGGEWLGWIENGTYQVGSKVNHPDFLWIPFEPGKPSGNRTGGNPHLDSDEVIGMWAEAVGFNPSDPFGDQNNPNTILNAPKDSESWGLHTPYYVMTLDGQNTGAAFVGKPIKLQISPKSGLSGRYDVQVFVNGEKKEDIIVESSVVTLDIDTSFGVNVLELRWFKDGEAQEGPSDQFRFYAMR